MSRNADKTERICANARSAMPNSSTLGCCRQTTAGRVALITAMFFAMQVGSAGGSSESLAFVAAQMLPQNVGQRKWWDSRHVKGRFSETHMDVLPKRRPLPLRAAAEPGEGSGSGRVRSFESDAGDNLNLIESYRKILAEVESAPPKPRKQDSMFTKLLASAKVTTCETDYDCNPGGRSWPRRCVSFVFSKICVDGDDDDFGGGGRIASMAMVRSRVLFHIPLP
jgi:hypothetical protein